MTRFYGLLLLGLAGVACDYAADPYRNEVNLAQNTQNVEGVYNDPEALRTEQAKPCPRHNQSGGSQVVANPTQNDNSAQNKESSYGNLQSGQNQNLKSTSNYENNFNYKFRPTGDARGANPNSALNSASQYNNPNSGKYKNVVPNQFDAANPTRTNSATLNANTAKTVNVPKAVNQLQNVNYGNENSPLYSNSPAEYQNVDNNYNQYQNSKPVLASQLNVANQYKKERSVSDYDDDVDDDDDAHDQQYDVLVANSRYDENRRVNNDKDYLVQNRYNNNEDKFIEKCPTASQSHLNDQDEDTRREKELYKFINQKLNEDYEDKPASQKLNENKANKKNYGNAQNFNDNQSKSPYGDDFGAYREPSNKSNKKYNQYNSAKNKASGLDKNFVSTIKKDDKDVESDENQNDVARKDNQKVKNSQAFETKKYSASDKQEEFADNEALNDNNDYQGQNINLKLNNKQTAKTQTQRVKNNQPNTNYESVQQQDYVNGDADTQNLGNQQSKNNQITKKQVLQKKENQYVANELDESKDNNENVPNYAKENNTRYKTKQPKTKAKELNGRSKNNQEESDEKEDVKIKGTKQPNRQVPRKQSNLENYEAATQNKASAVQPVEKATNSKHQKKYGEAVVSYENDGDDPDKYQFDEDYEEDYKDDLSGQQSRRTSNPSDQNDSDCDSDEEVQNQQALKKNVKNQKQQESDVEEVDVNVRSGRRQKVLIGEHTRVCYACSSASNPTCLKPNRQTTVKYCQRGHDSCITKLFKGNGIEILTRDCGTSCNDNIIPGVTPKYAKCSVCHSDLCNGAFSLSGQNMFFICAMAVVTVTKYFM